MKKFQKIFLPILLLLAAGFTYYSSDFQKKTTSDIIVSFVTYNAYGNNLYLDNLHAGQKPDYDLAVIAIKNIGIDTTYIADTSITMVPEVIIFNTGKTNITGNIYISLSSSELGYNHTDSITGLNAEYTAVIYFDTLTIHAGTSFNITAAAFANDTIGSNDTLRQFSCYLKGAPKKILLEEFTSTTSVACGAQNPYLDSFAYAHSDRIAPVKYHLGFPQPGIDSMYLADTTVNVRAKYYSVKSVPNAFYNGITKLGLPYSTDSVMNAGFDFVKNQSSPVSISVHDTLIAGDTIQSTIIVNNLYSLSGNNFRLLVYALEREINYAQPPGTNDEITFRDVFRRGYPDITGTPVTSVPGNYQYIYKYHVDPSWTDTNVYTLAFIQNNDNHEVMNCGTGKTFSYMKKNFNKKRITLKGKFIPDFAPYNPVTEFSKRIFNYNRSPKNVLLNSTSFYELFEYKFPPNGWVILNNDESSTFEAVDGYNGPTYGGFRCIRMPFYEYSEIGAIDGLTSVIIPGVSVDDTLSFDYAYAQYLSNYADSLSVLVSTDNGSTFHTIFSAGGKDLATAPATTLSFAPTSPNMWKTFYYPMSALLNPQDIFTGLPAQFQLQQNYPNPFNPVTTIMYKVLKPGYVTLRVYDITGRMIKELFTGYRTTGTYPVEFNSTGISSGVYFYRMSSGDNADTKKMVIVK